MARRIVSIQHGDYSDGLRRMRAGEPEHYFGVRHALDSLAELFGNDPHLVISLNSQPYHITEGSGEYTGIPQPSLPWGAPRTIGMLLWAQAILAKVRAFNPTHVLLRTGDILGVRILQHCVRHRINAMANFAFYLDPKTIQSRFVTRKLVHLLNDPCVYLVGNHKTPATQSLVAWGLNPNKAVAWDWPGARHPRDYPVKSLDTVKPAHIVYVGNVTEQKGVGDLMDAVGLLQREGRAIHLSVAGAGLGLEAMRARARALPEGLVNILGSVDNNRAFQLMLESALVCVPSRHEFTEGMPLTLTEALASRTPVAISDHPVFKEAFHDREGVRFFTASSPQSLARMIAGMLDDSTAYAELSRCTAAAYERVECPTSFGDLLRRWKATF